MAETLIALVGRHGETDLNERNCFRSWSDVKLNENGLKQAKRMASYLKDADIKRVICSPLERAFETAVQCAAPHGLFPEQDRGLFPWRLGVFSGLDRDENNEALRLFVQNPDVCIPHGESLEDFESRQFVFWKRALAEARSTGLTLFVTHTSDLISLINFTEGAHDVEPEMGGESVKPGGVAAVYWDGEKHRVEPIFGGEEEAVFGGS